MYNFVALISKAGSIASCPEAVALNESLCRNSQEWALVMDAGGGVAVYGQKPADRAMRTYLLPANAGVVLGRLFRRGSPAHRVSADEVGVAQSPRSGKLGLPAEYWGTYVAILRSPEDHTVSIIRDCSGKIPCYYIELSSLYIFFSDIRDIGALGIHLSINVRYLVAFLLHHPLHVRETGLLQVFELLAGDRVSISSKGMRHNSLWSPPELAGASLIDNYNQAKAELVATTEDVIRCWASAYDGIVLSLSGGLDSAIVLGCLSRLGIADRVVCLNEYTEDTSDDERSYARSAANMAGVRLIELPRISDALLYVDKLRNAPPDPNPYVTTGLRMLSADRFGAVAAQFQCNTVWTGQGGDHVFLQTRDAYHAVDYLLQHSFPYRLPAILYDTALLSGHSYWSVLGHAILALWRRDAGTPVPFDHSGAAFINDSVLHEVPAGYAIPPWHDGTARVPPGKRTQIDTFSDLLNRHKPLLGYTPYECHPLVSQPLLELSLRIPTYHLLKGGRQRAMARDAFADRVPPSILRREDKGLILDHTRVLFRGGGGLLREALLQGTLASLGILNRHAVERIIDAADTYKAEEFFGLAGCMAAEMWATQWARQPGFKPA
jgi:asparagine synthase (glutamine-hydrolysing)